ncbi:MAG: cupin domain-containing protein [Candidatus Eisenbacteria bacterium]
MTSVTQIAAMLKLKPLPVEGGYFAETYRSTTRIPGEALPEGYGGTRPLCTAIYYLLTPDTFSAMHRLRSDEIYHFYLGDPVEMLQIRPDGSFKMLRLGLDIPNGMEPQIVIPGGVWQGSRLLPGGEFALLGATMAPGFDPADYEHGHREDLTRFCPGARDLIAALTRE